MKLQIGTFAEGFNQTSLFRLAFKNENAAVYSMKLPFRRFLLITI